jgi:hypothetical protein
MPRTIVNLMSDDKAWLDAEAKRRGQSMTSLVSEAVAEYRVRHVSDQSPSLEQCLSQTAGLWRQGDGLVWQNHMRDEWASSDGAAVDESA